MKKTFTKTRDTLFLTRLFLFIGLLAYTTNAYATIWYVKETSTGSGNGSNWDNASGYLYGILEASASGDEVWVAKGTYQRPYSGQSFSMVDGVKIYGGFAGNEESLAARDLTIGDNASILWGHGTYVVIAPRAITNTAVLDGFTISYGTRGGIYNAGSPTIKNCTIKNNTNTDHGGGIYNFIGASPVLINCSISNNSSDKNGGGIYITSGITITNCSFIENEALHGGGAIYNNAESPVVLTNCSFTLNAADEGGGMYNSNSSSETLVLTNCSFIQNGANHGGAMYNYLSSVKLRNCIIYGNVDSGIDNIYSSVDIRHSLVQQITSTDDKGNISSDTAPLFVDPLNVDHRPQPCSPVINKGSNTYYEVGQTPDLSAITTDLSGEPRFYETVDMGAYEYAGSPVVPTLADNNAEFTQTIYRNGTLIGVNGSPCTVIASVARNGSTPLSGDLTAKVWVEATQPTNFVKRHYQLTPTRTGTETATAKVTLYFTQQEFDEFNDANSIKLPVDPEDTENYKANLRIEKRSGSSSDNFGLPGSYNGTVVTINPLDPAVNGSITWNTWASRWEVSFDVTGFSGFFVKTTEAALPLNLISFTATKESGVNLLNWKTTNEINTLNFEVQSSSDAKRFAKITTVPANGSGNHQYSYQDETPYFGTIYYRLKMVDRNGSFAYSKIISLMNDAVGKATIHPNPAVESITLTISPSLLQSTATLYDVTGHLLQRILLTTNKQQVDVKSLSSGVYILMFANGTAERFVKE